MNLTKPHGWLPAALPFALALGPLTCAGCSAPGETSSPDTHVPAVRYTSKVKNLLTGTAIDAREAQAVVADPAALRGLIDRFMTTPEFHRKMLEFFKQAFQQTQIGFIQFAEQLGSPLPNLNPVIKSYLVRSAEMSFPITALVLVDEGRPFTEVLTTDRFMLNPPLMTLLAYLDNLVVDDEGNKSSFLARKFGSRFRFAVHYDDSTQVPFEESIDPNSPHFLQFYEACPRRNGIPDCNVVSVASSERVDHSLFTYLLGARFTDPYWNDWRMIRIRPPRPGEDPSFYVSLPSFHSHAPEQQELVLNVPRVGFMTTPAFFANWPTNLSNLARVSINQTLIVGLGYSLADTNAIVPVSETGNPDAQHSQAGTSCYACHQTLDPMRNFFRRDFSVTYHRQTLRLPPEQQTAQFTVDGKTTDGSGVRDLAAAMAAEARFATAWTQKLCQYANSAACLEDDPELIRVANAFRDKNHDFKTLVRELFSSPLVTHATPTKSFEEPEGAVTIARRDHFCAALQNRLGLLDICDLGSTLPTLLQNLSFGIPGAAYSRGASAPLLPREPDLFFSSSVEGLCTEVAARAVDPTVCAPGQRCFSSAEAHRAVGDLTRVVLSLPSDDPRCADIERILTEHYDEATSAGYSATDALRSTFVIACSSPLSSAIGL
jgi:Protein of unknown function (DUF1585)